MQLFDKTPIKSDDWKSWIVHTLKMFAVAWFFTLMVSPTAGFVIGILVIFLREKDQNNNEYEFWLWRSWDSLLDWFFPLIGLILNYWLTVLLFEGAYFS